MIRNESSGAPSWRFSKRKAPCAPHQERTRAAGTGRNSPIEGDGEIQRRTEPGHEATWQSLKPEVLRFANAGSAQAVSRGETVISVEFHGARRTQLVRGFDDKTLNLSVSTHQVQNFELIPLAASVDLAGSWRLRISAPDDCSSKLPEDVRQREFSVSIAQDGSHIAFTPSSPTIASGGPIDGRIFADAFSVNLSFDDYYLTYGLLDRPSPTDWVGIRGTMEGTSTVSSVQGAFSGAFDYYRTVPEATGPAGVPIVCLGSSPFVLTRESARPARRR